MRKLDSIERSFDGLKVLQSIDLEIKDNQIISIIGPSGCGKSTLLNIIAGLDEEYSGLKTGFDGPVSYLFQDLRLLPWKSVYENMEFVLKGKIPKEELESTIMSYLRQVELEDYRDFAIHEISGGMQQRLSIARAFAYPSELLLMDEPFKSLDFEIRHHIIKTFYKIWTKSPRTVVFVTHDIQSALMLSDQIVLLSKKPTVVAKSYMNELEQEERKMGMKGFMELEKQIYEDFINLSH